VYVPAELVTAWLATCVAWFVTVTFALGTTAPDASATVPVIPLNACACSPDGKETSKRQIAKQSQFRKITKVVISGLPRNVICAEKPTPHRQQFSLVDIVYPFLRH